MSVFEMGSSSWSDRINRYKDSLLTWIELRRLIWKDFMLRNISDLSCLIFLYHFEASQKHYIGFSVLIGSYADFYYTFMALSLFAKLLMIESDSWKRELPVSATSEISWLTAMMIWNRDRNKRMIKCREKKKEKREKERIRRRRKTQIHQML